MLGMRVNSDIVNGTPATGDLNVPLERLARAAAYGEDGEDSFATPTPMLLPDLERAAVPSNSSRRTFSTGAEHMHMGSHRGRWQGLPRDAKGAAEEVAKNFGIQKESECPAKGLAARQGCKLEGTGCQCGMFHQCYTRYWRRKGGWEPRPILLTGNRADREEDEAYVNMGVCEISSHVLVAISIVAFFGTFGITLLVRMRSEEEADRLDQEECERLLAQR